MHHRTIAIAGIVLAFALVGCSADAVPPSSSASAGSDEAELVISYPRGSNAWAQFWTVVLEGPNLGENYLTAIADQDFQLGDIGADVPVVPDDAVPPPSAAQVANDLPRIFSLVGIE